MSSPALLQSIPSGLGGEPAWLFWHARDHDFVRGKIAAAGGPRFPRYILGDLSEDAMETWLDAHQQAHNEVNGYLGLRGSDLRDVDLGDPAQREQWVYQNAQEHIAMHRALGA